MFSLDLLQILLPYCPLTDFVVLTQASREIRQICQENRQLFLDLFFNRLWQGQSFNFDHINFPFFLYQNPKNAKEWVFRIYTHDFWLEEASHPIFKVIAALEEDFAKKIDLLHHKPIERMTLVLGKGVSHYCVQVSIPKEVLTWDDLDFYLQKMDTPEAPRTVFRNYEVTGEITGMRVEWMADFSASHFGIHCQGAYLPCPLVEKLEQDNQEMERELEEWQAKETQKEEEERNAVKRKRRKRRQKPALLT